MNKYELWGQCIIYGEECLGVFHASTLIEAIRAGQKRWPGWDYIHCKEGFPYTWKPRDEHTFIPLQQGDI